MGDPISESRPIEQRVSSYPHPHPEILKRRQQVQEASVQEKPAESPLAPPAPWNAAPPVTFTAAALPLATLCANADRKRQHALREARAIGRRGWWLFFVGLTISVASGSALVTNILGDNPAALTTTLAVSSFVGVLIQIAGVARHSAGDRVASYYRCSGEYGALRDEAQHVLDEIRAQAQSIPSALRWRQDEVRRWYTRLNRIFDDHMSSLDLD